MGMRRPVLIMMIAIIVGGGLLVNPQTPVAHAATVVGGVDVNEYCRVEWGGESQLWSPWSPPDAYAWRCRLVTWGWYPSVNIYNISMNDVCQFRYGAGTWAEATDPNNPYSWRCLR